jgi:hypothetical protein
MNSPGGVPGITVSIQTMYLAIVDGRHRGGRPASLLLVGICIVSAFSGGISASPLGGVQVDRCPTNLVRFFKDSANIKDAARAVRAEWQIEGALVNPSQETPLHPEPLGLDIGQGGLTGESLSEGPLSSTALWDWVWSQEAAAREYTHHRNDNHLDKAGSPRPKSSRASEPFDHASPGGPHAARVTL